MVMITTRTPEVRADILAEVVRQVARLPAPATYHAIFTSVLAAFGKPEEEMAFDIEAAVHLLVRTGLIESSTYDGFQMVFAGRSTLKSSEPLTTFIFHETSGYYSEEEGGAS